MPFLRRIGPAPAERMAPMKSRMLTGLSLLVVLAACDRTADPTEPFREAALPEVTRNADAPIQTDSMTYRLDLDGIVASVTIGLRFTNSTTDTIYVVNCREILPASLQKRIRGEWVDFWHPIIPACLSPPIRIAPGAVYAGAFPILGLLPNDDASPQFASDELEGVYRIVLHGVVWNYQDNLPFGEPVPLEGRLSNEFVLDDPRR